MPSLGTHLIFASEVRAALPAALPAIGAVAATHWAAAMLAALGMEVGIVPTTDSLLEAAAPARWINSRRRR